MCHALHRLLAPRHPPYALSNLIHVRPRNCITTSPEQDPKSKILFGMDVSIHSRSIQLLRCQVRLVQTFCLASARSFRAFTQTIVAPADVSPVAVPDLVIHSDQRPIVPHKKRPIYRSRSLRTADTLEATFMLFKSCSLVPYRLLRTP